MVRKRKFLDGVSYSHNGKGRLVCHFYLVRQMTMLNPFSLSLKMNKKQNSFELRIFLFVFFDSLSGLRHCCICNAVEDRVGQRYKHGESRTT